MAKSQRRGNARRKPTRVVDQDMLLEFAVDQLRAGQAPATVRTMLAGEFDIGITTCATTLQRALVVLDGELTEERQFHRSLQVHRLVNTIQRALSKEKWADAIRAESVLSQILGTRAPTQIEINPDQAVRDAFVKIAGSISSTDRERLIEEQAELEAKARAGMNGGARHG